MKLRDVEWHKKTKNISQVSSDGLEFAFLTSDYRQIHQLVWCKDFLQDAIHGQLTNKKISIYGFSYDPSIDPPLHIDSTRLMLASRRDRDFDRKIKNSLIFLHKIEKHLKMLRTVYEKCASPPKHYARSGVYIFNGSKRWMKSPPMISLYTLLIRVGLAHDPTMTWQETIEGIRKESIQPYYSYDTSFLKNGKTGMDRIFKFGDRRLFYRDIKDNYPNDVNTGRMHNDYGIVGYSLGVTSTRCPHWHRNLEKKK